MMKCPKCTKSYKQKSNLTTHINKTHPEFKPYICQKCDKSIK